MNMVGNLHHQAVPLSQVCYQKGQIKVAFLASLTGSVGTKQVGQFNTFKLA